MAPRTFARISGFAGLIGVVMLGVSFKINPGPPQVHPTQAQFDAYGLTHYAQTMVGGWLQAVGTVLCIAFALAVVQLADAMKRYAGLLTLYGGMLLAAVDLVEVALYFSAATAAQAATPLISLDLIHALQRLYFVVTAPAVFFPLGVVILSSRVLPRWLGYAAIGFALLFAALGVADLFLQLQAVDDVVGSVQGVWWLLASIALIARSGAFAATVTRPLAEPERALA